MSLRTVRIDPCWTLERVDVPARLISDIAVVLSAIFGHRFHELTHQSASYPRNMMLGCGTKREALLDGSGR